MKLRISWTSEKQATFKETLCTVDLVACWQHTLCISVRYLM